MTSIQKVKSLARMRGLLALGAPLGGPAYVDPGGVQVAYRVIILREQYLWPQVPGAPEELPEASADVTITVYENGSLYDKINQRRPFESWRSMRSRDPFFLWRKESSSGMRQTVENTREVLRVWQVFLFSRAQEGGPPILKLTHTDENLVSTLQSGRKRRVRDAAKWPPTRGP